MFSNSDFSSVCCLRRLADMVRQRRKKKRRTPYQISMRQKLEATSKVLEGLAIEDKELVHEGSTRPD